MVIGRLMQHGGVEVSVIELGGWQILGALSIHSMQMDPIFQHTGYLYTWGVGELCTLYTQLYPIYCTCIYGGRVDGEAWMVTGHAT